MAEIAQRFEVEVVFAQSEQQQLQRVMVAEGCTAAEAIDAAGLSTDWQGETDQPLPLARFGRLIAADTPLAAGDRVEILRPLSIDPKDQRRQRARAASRARRRTI